MMAPAHIAELIALVDAGGGVADIIDPASKRKITMIEIKRLRPDTEPLTDDEMRDMLDVAQKDYEAGRASKRYTEELLAYARRQLPTFSPAR
jgi:hypothetical protein